MSEEKSRGEREDGPNTDHEAGTNTSDRKEAGTDKPHGKRRGSDDPIVQLIGALFGDAIKKAGGIHGMRVAAERREVRKESRDANNSMGEIEFDPPTGENIAKHRDGIQRLITALVGTPVDRIDGLVVGARCWEDYNPEEGHDDGHHHVCELPDGRKVVAKMLMCGMGDTRLAKALMMKLACQLEEIEIDETEAAHNRRLANGEEPCVLCGEFHDDEEHPEAEPKPAAEANTR
jgi:hypothetical protein